MYDKENAVHLGRKKNLTDQERIELKQKRQNGVLIKTLMEEYNLLKASVYRYLNGITVEPA